MMLCIYIMSVLEPLEHSVLEVFLEVGDGFVDRVAVSNLLEHSGASVPADPPSTSHPMILSEVSGDGRNGQQDHMCEDNMLRDIWREDKRPSPEDGDAIMVGAVGSAVTMVSDGLG